MTKRRTFSPQFRAQIALKALRGDMSRAALCREHNLGPDLVSRWCQQLIDRAVELFSTPASQSAEQVRIEELERLVGQLTFELAAAKKLSALLSSRSIRNGR
jgi:transposase-like protein